jgi:hypothetical protein
MIEEQIKAQTKVLLEIKDILDKSSQRQSSIAEHVKAMRNDIGIMSGTIAVDTVRNQGGEVVEQKVVVDNLKDVLSVVNKGSQRFIRITALGEDFCLGLKLAEDGKEMKWQEAIDYCKERQRDLLTKRQYLIVAIFHDEINKMLEDLGGDKLGYEWSVSEGNNYYAWFYYGFNGTLDVDRKYLSCQVRPSLAHFSNL